MEPYEETCFLYGPSLRFISVFHESSTVSDWYESNIIRVGSATETKSDWSEFIFRPFPWKCMEKKIVWRPIRTHAGLISSPSCVNTSLVLWFWNIYMYFSVVPQGVNRKLWGKFVFGIACIVHAKTQRVV